MAKAFGPTIKKLQKAINDKYDAKILVNKNQWYSEQAKRPLETIVIKQAQWNDKKQRYIPVELFRSMSDVQIVLWLRDYWYELNGWEVPTDNEKWQEVKAKYQEEHLPTKEEPKVPNYRKRHAVLKR